MDNSDYWLTSLQTYVAIVLGYMFEEEFGLRGEAWVLAFPCALFVHLTII